MDETTNTIPAEAKGGFGGVMGAIIIIVILVAGGWYFIGGRVEKIQEQKASIANEVVTGTSTEVTDIQKDLDNVNLDILNQ
jgi:hypothetical protein